MLGELKTRLDYEDYAMIPSDGRRWELLDGEPYVTPAPGTAHQRASKRLQRQLEAYFEDGHRGEVFNAPVDVILTPNDVVQPDLVVATDPSQVSARGIEGAPTLLVEVLSPSNRAFDRTTKARRYAALGVAHLWFLDPELQTLDCFRNVDGTFRAAGSFGAAKRSTHPEFPGLEIDLAAIWR